MNPDRLKDKADKAKGAAKEAVGSVKEAVGKLTGDEKLKAEGKADKALGRVLHSHGIRPPPTLGGKKGQ